MAVLSNDIEVFIKVLLQNGNAELQRNELAEKFHCAPSQINYVLTTRFSLDKGYVVRSRRGGGGYIRVFRIDINQNHYILDIINRSLKESISYREAVGILEGLLATGIITKEQKKIILAAISEKALVAAQYLQDAVRTSILKQVLIAMLYEE